MKLQIRTRWNNHTGWRRWFSWDACREMRGDGWFYIGITACGVSMVAFDVG